MFNLLFYFISSFHLFIIAKTKKKKKKLKLWLLEGWFTCVLCFGFTGIDLYLYFGFGFGFSLKCRGFGWFLGKKTEENFSVISFYFLRFLCRVKGLLVAKTSGDHRTMAFEHYFSQEWKSIQGVSTDSENSNGCFDCNICLEFAHEPVVTLCGHLYCWPCIYKWLYVQSASLASDEHPQCPVCKADISHTTMVPLYGRGQSLNEPEIEGKAAHRGMDIPPRPAACGNHALISSTPNTGQQLPYRNPYQSPHHNPHPYISREEDSTSPWLNPGGTMRGFHHPVVGMFGDMVYTRVFGNSASLYAYPNSYHIVGSSSPRMRRQEMQIDKSLNRISIFLFCCFLLCLIVF